MIVLKWVIDKMIVEKSVFLIELESIDREIANWAEKHMKMGHSISNIKRKLCQLAVVAKRQ